MTGMRFALVLGGAILAAGLAGCNERLVGVDLKLSPEQRDEAQRRASRPLIEHEADFEAVTVEADVPVPLTRFAAWFAAKGAASLALLPIDADIAAAEPRSVSLSGEQTRMRPGDRRRLILGRDTALAEVVSNQADRLEYEVWNLTTYFGRYITYGIGDLAFSPGPRGTTIRWTFSFRPVAGPDSWLIRPYVRGTFRQSMSTALSALGARAGTELARQ